MRDCPVCSCDDRVEVFGMDYKIPDGWPLPEQIDWYTCAGCGMIYGDGEFDQAMLNEYYIKYYGYGVTNPDHRKRLTDDAFMISELTWKNACIVDFGGAGDDGRSVLVDALQANDFVNAVCIGPGEELPKCDVLYASHVIEHIYDLPKTMKRLVDALAPDGLLIMDIPDAMGLLKRWKMPILDFNTKHINHFTLRNILDLAHNWGLEAVLVKPYELEFAPCYQVHFRRLDVARESRDHIVENIDRRLGKVDAIKEPVNIWGMSDIVWHILAYKDLNVLNYIDNDPAYRGATYNGKPVLERPDNDAPIVIMAQGQRGRLIENIRKAGVTNPIVEI